MIPVFLIDDDIKKWLSEDIPYWDITTSLLPEEEAEGKIFTKQTGVVAGLFILERIFSFVGAEFIPLVKDGTEVEDRIPIASVKGKFHSILQAERVSLNILGRLSGIATKTAAMVKIAKEYNPKLRICGTRKVVPGLGKYDKYAITLGGGDTHRFNLSDMILLKENHLAAFESITDAIKTAKERTSFSKKVEVEVQNEREAMEAAKAGADIIMLDNFTPEEVKHTIPKVKEFNSSALVEISGNITLENLSDYSIKGVDLISSGSLTHSVENFDFSMLIEKK